MERKNIAFLCCVIAASACAVTWLFTSMFFNSNFKDTELRLSAENYETISELLDLSDLEDLIDEYYYQEVDENTLINGALKGMVDALDDPYSVYYTEEEYKEYNQASDGTFVGIGISLIKDEQTGYLSVVNVTDNSPAAEGGIIIGDIIKSIDGVDVSKMNTDDAVELVKGPVGSAVTLGLLRDGEDVSMELVRAEIQNQFVFYTMYDNLCYIIIEEFHGDVSADFEKAIQFAYDENASGIILDVRGNLGGSVKECTEIADMLLPEGLIVYTEDKDGERTEYTSDADMCDLPLVMLVNEASASSSEILAGAIQDLDRGEIIGTQTYGKGVVQSVIDMPYSGGGVKLTSSVYYTPLGKSINGVGITPDYEVQLPEDVLSGDTALSFDTDSQLQKAIEILNENVASSDAGETE